MTLSHELGTSFLIVVSLYNANIHLTVFQFTQRNNWCTDQSISTFCAYCNNNPSLAYIKAIIGNFYHLQTIFGISTNLLARSYWSNSEIFLLSSTSSICCYHISQERLLLKLYEATNFLQLLIYRTLGRSSS